MISPESKFVGEALEQRDVRTVFVSAREDNKDRENRVILLIGPSSAQKSELIDFLCNYFYGIDAIDQKRYHIADEKFNAKTPERPVQCYIFNETKMSVRPVILDTIGCGEAYHDLKTPTLINKWLLDNWKMRLDIIGIVFSDLHRMSMHEEDELQKVLSQLPEHVLGNIVVFITASDGSRAFETLLRRFNLSNCPKFTINTSCIFQKQMEDRLNDEHRRRYWKMSVNQFNEFFRHAQETTPVTISGLPYVDDGLYGVHESAGGSSRSSVYSSSKSTVIEVPTTAPPPSTRPTTAPPPLPSTAPPPPPTPATKKTTPPPPPPKPTIHAPPTPASPPPLEPQGIPLYSEKLSPPKPKPPSFAPPVPPLITDTSTTTTALTNAMFEQLKQSSAQYDYATYGSERAYPVQARYDEPPSEPAGGLGNRRHSVPDDIRHYADETTPPPVPHDVVDRYSTLAYMNHEANQYSTRVSHSPTRSQVGVRDAHRLSRDDLRIVDAHSSPSDSQSEELRRMYSGRSANSVKPTGDVTARYVYDTANRNYTAYGEERQARQSYTSTHATDRKRWSRSSEPRSETYINDPYYSGKDVVSGYGVIETRRSRTSLHSHGGSVPELIHSENKYDYQQLSEQQRSQIERQSRQDAERRSTRHSEGSRQIYIDRQISPERQRKDYGTVYTNVNMHDNPRYNIPRTEVPPPPIPPKTVVQPVVQPTPIIHRVSGGEVYEDERSVYEAYSQIQHQRPPPSIPHTIPQPQIGRGIQPNPIQLPPHTIVQQPQPYLPSYDQVPDPSQSNHYIIPKSMRGSGSPIQVRVHLASKSPDSVRRQQYDTYGEPIYVTRGVAPGLTEETTTTTTTTRKEEIERKRKKKEEENRRKGKEHQNGGQKQVIQQNGYDTYANNGSQHDYGRYDNRGNRDAEEALVEEEYNTRHMKRTTEHPQRHYPPDPVQIEDGDGYGYGYGREDYSREGHGKGKGHHHSQHRNEKTVTRRTNKFGWSPSNYRNPQDCFLNLLCFIIAPLVFIAIIIVIIVFVIIN